MILNEGQVFEYNEMRYVVLANDIDEGISYYICGNVDCDRESQDELSVFYYNDIGCLSMLLDKMELNKLLPKFQEKLENEIRRIINEMGEKENE